MTNVVEDHFDPQPHYGGFAAFYIEKSIIQITKITVQTKKKN
jgi:hypothetical protein